MAGIKVLDDDVDFRNMQQVVVELQHRDCIKQ